MCRLTHQQQQQQPEVVMLAPSVELLVVREEHKLVHLTMAIVEMVAAVAGAVQVLQAMRPLVLETLALWMPILEE